VQPSDWPGCCTFPATPQSSSRSDSLLLQSLGSVPALSHIVSLCFTLQAHGNAVAGAMCRGTASVDPRSKGESSS
jgi:hypothetical protein